MAGALAGIRVIDLSTALSELAGRTLAQLGAEVIKVEIAGCTDQARQLPPFAADGVSLYWQFVGQGKRLLQIAHDAADLVAQVHRLLEGADILIESLSATHREQLGLLPAQLLARYPALIAVSVSAFGLTGPRAHEPANELTLEAASGFMSVNGDQDRPPLPQGFPQAAFHAGVQAAADALIALEARRRTGVGQHVDVSTQAAMIAGLQTSGFSAAATLRARNPHEAGDDRALPMKDLYRALMPMAAPCKDGFVTFSFVGYALGEQSFEKTLSWMLAEGWQLPETQNQTVSSWRQKLEANTLPAATVTALVEQLRKFLLGKTKAELMQFALAEKVLMAPSSTIADLLVDEQLRVRGAFVEMNGYRTPGVPFNLSRTPLTTAPAPLTDAASAALQQDHDVGTAQSAPRRAPVADASAIAHVTEHGALAGLKVIDFSWALAGPITTRTLGDHGATVIRIESRRRLDVARGMPPLTKLDDGSSYSHAFGTANTSKQSVTLDLTTDAGRALVQRLIDWADVVVENFTPGVMQRLGMDYATLSRTRPGLIMLSSSMYGGNGPGARYAGFGTQGSALAGLHAITGWPDRVPTGPSGAYTDVIAPRFSVAALMAALRHRHSTGEGQHIELSQVECAMQFIGPLVLAAQSAGSSQDNAAMQTAHGTDSDRYAPHGVYAALDHERYVAVAIESADEWQALSMLVQLPQIAAHFTAREHLNARRALRPQVDQALGAWLAQRSAAEAAQALCAAGVPAAVVSRPTDLLSDPQLLHRDYLAQMDVPGRGATTIEMHSSNFTLTSARVRRPPPVLGQHTEAVLRDLLALSSDEIAALRTANVLR